MHTLEQTLVSFFELVAQKDSDQLNKLKQEQRFTVEPGRWCFSLPDLHLFIQHHNDVFNDIDYRRFRQVIFNSLINQAVKSYGAEINITDNQANVDKSTYALVWHAG